MLTLLRPQDAVVKNETAVTVLRGMLARAVLLQSRLGVATISPLPK